jgi:hypothetical protein
MNPTLSSLAFSLFRSSFIPEELKVETKVKKGNKEIVIIDSKIHILSKEIDSFIRSSYFGGHVDAYIPHFENSLAQWEGQILNHYDVVSLYPSVMEKFDMPYAIKNYFKGDLRKNDLNLYNNSLGFYKVNIMSPTDLINPIIPFRTDKATVIYPTGYWGGVYFSEELKNAEKYGYKFKLLAGYIFEYEYLFKGYIESMNKLKEDSTKNSIDYLIAKLLMNSLYGRFGMNPNTFKHKFLDEKALSDLANSIGVENIHPIIDLNNTSLVSFTDSFSTSSKSNIAIALAITAYGRITMSQFLNNYKLTGDVYYTDTDSIFIEKELPNHLVNPKQIGFMKLENTLKSFVALGPKAYGGVTLEGETFTKVKGFKNILDLFDLKMASRLEGVSMCHTKWFKKVSDANINVRDVKYNLKPNSLKR